MHPIRYSLVLGVVLFSHNLSYAEEAISNYSGVTSSTFDTLYRTVPAVGVQKQFVNDPNGRVTKGLVQLTLTDNGQNQYQSALIESKNVADPIGATRWYGFSIYLPTQWVVNNSPVKVAEIVSSNSSLPPPVALTVNGSDLQVTLSANHRTPGSSDPPTAANTQSRTFTLARVEPGKWHCVYIRATWSGTQRTGDTAIWVNGEGVASYTAVQTHNSYQGVTMTPRVGLASNGALGVTSRTAVVDGIILGNERASAPLFQNNMPCPIPAQ